MPLASFDSAVRALVQVHDAEINTLLQQLARFRNSDLALQENDAEAGLSTEFHHYPSPCASRHAPVTPKKNASISRQKPVSLRQVSLGSPEGMLEIIVPRDQCERENGTLSDQCTIPASEPKAAEHGNGITEDSDRHEIHERSMRLWVTLAQGALSRSRGHCDYIVREGWLKTPDTGRVARENQSKLDMILVRAKRKTKTRVSNGLDHRFSLLLPRLQHRHSTCIAHPDSSIRRMWVWLSFLVILYEVMAITMLPFDAFGNERSSILETGSATFWICDVIFTFFTGIFIHGRYEVRLRAIAKKYLRTWFAFDFAVAGMQAISLVVDIGRMSTSGTLLKIIRVVRALRLSRSMSWFQAVFQKVLSYRASIFGARVGQCLVALCFFVHVNACLWYHIGKRPNGWVSEFNKFGNSAGEKYLVAMHWSLSQLQGSIDVEPGRASSDRLYAVLSSFASIIFLALLVSTMTDALFTAQDERKAFAKQMRMVEIFFHRHHVRPALRKRAEYYLKVREREEHSLGYEDQDRQALEMFPPQLKWRLLAESRASVIAWHTLFLYLQDFYASLFAHICTEVLIWHAYQPEDDAFMSSTRSTGAYYIASGHFVFNGMLGLQAVFLEGFASYFGSLPSPDLAQGGTSVTTSSTVPSSESLEQVNTLSYQDIITRKSNTRVTRLHAGQLISEISLWSPWSHAGDMSAVNHGQCFNIRWSELISLLDQYRDAYHLFSSYATRFVNAATKLRSKYRSDQEVELMGCADLLGIENAEPWQSQESDSS